MDLHEKEQVFEQIITLSKNRRMLSNKSQTFQETTRLEKKLVRRKTIGLATF
jgi:hypothetical protein